MNRLKTLFVQFESDLGKHQVPAFRGAIIEKVGRENLLFHNHKSDRELYYGYPLIQYKSLQRKPALFCIGQGVDEIHKLFAQKNWDIVVNGEKLSLKIDRLDLNSLTLNVWDKEFEYGISNWVALNADNYRKYQEAGSMIEKIALLEGILTSNILAFAKGVGWTIDKPISLSIQEISNEKIIRYKSTALSAFDVRFRCNVFLPNHLGLGKSVSHGFGMLRGIKKKTEE